MDNLKRLLVSTAAGMIFCFASVYLPAQQIITLPHVQADWTYDFEPFCIAGNLYYVGTAELASYLITTRQGNILINTGLRESVPMIRAHVEKLGFKFSDIKILLSSQAHYDHVAGMAAIKKETGAKLMIEKGDAPIMADGGNSDYIFGGKGGTFEAAKADKILNDHDTVRLGEMKIIVLHHPGHTKGACSFLFDVHDRDHSYRVLIANMPTILSAAKKDMATYPEIAVDYRQTLDKMKLLQFDLWLAAHAGQFELQKKRVLHGAYNPEAFRDQRRYDSSMNVLEKEYSTRFNE